MPRHFLFPPETIGNLSYRNKNINPQSWWEWCGELVLKLCVSYHSTYGHMINNLQVHTPIPISVEHKIGFQAETAFSKSEVSHSNIPHMLPMPHNHPLSWQIANESKITAGHSNIKSIFYFMHIFNPEKNKNKSLILCSSS